MGHAIRHAIALGLHLRVGTGIDTHQQQLRSRTWWSLYGLEQILGDFTGRPTSIMDSDIAVPLDWSHESRFAPATRQTLPFGDARNTLLARTPRAVRDMQYSPHLYFVCRIRLSIIGHKVRSSLYASGKTDERWSKFQDCIRELDEELTQWATDLPLVMSLPLGVDVYSSDQRDGQLLDRFELALAYQSMRMILFRPCLYHLKGVIPHESTLWQSFNQKAAVTCVSAARTLLALLPKGASYALASKMLPCWSLLHYINQAGAVLILELGLKAEHMPSQVRELLTDVGKVVSLLAEMAADSLSAWRSWKIFCKLYLQAAAGVGIDVTIPESVQKPPGWKAANKPIFSRTLNVPAHHPANVQMVNHLHQQAGMADVPTSDVLFGATPHDCWHLLPNMPASANDLAFNERHAYPRSSGEATDEMDWRS